LAIYQLNDINLNILKQVPQLVLVVFVVVIARQEQYDINLLTIKHGIFKHAKCQIHVTFILEKELSLLRDNTLITFRYNSNHEIEHNNHIEDSLDEPDKPDDVDNS